MRVLVIGASGFLGSNIGRLIRGRGWTAVGLSRSRPLGYPVWKRLEPNTVLRQVLAETASGLVLNCAAIASHEACEQNPDLARLVNAELPSRWAADCRDVGAKMVHISSDAVFSGAESTAYKEDSLTDATSAYGRSKREGELRVLERNGAALVVRTNFFGWSPSGRIGILDFFYRALRHGAKPAGFYDYITSSIYIPHLADLMWRSVEADVSGILHLAAAAPLSKYEFGQLVATYAGASKSLIRRCSKATDTNLASRGDDLALATSRAQALLGITPATIETGVQSALSDRRATWNYFDNARKIG